ncbi:MAG: regulatory protein RecX [Gemmatimonadales bacterium]
MRQPPNPGREPGAAGRIPNPGREPGAGREPAAPGAAGRITAIRPDTHATGYVIVEVDGERFATIAADAVKDLGLVREMELDRGTFERLSFQADVDGAYRVAVRLLAARPRSVRELLWRLRQRGLNPSAVAKAVGRLEERGLLDDHEFARHFVRVRSDKGHGPSRLLTDLLAKGVDRKLAQRAIDEVLAAEGVDPLAQARVLAEKRVRQLERLPPDKQRRRLLAYLDRRGFRGHEVRELVEEVVGVHS